jgi:hypothetical protein
VSAGVRLSRTPGTTSRATMRSRQCRHQLPDRPPHPRLSRDPPLRRTSAIAAIRAFDCRTSPGGRVSRITRRRTHGGIRCLVRIFFTVFKGAPTARQPSGPGGPDRAQRARCHGGECVLAELIATNGRGGEAVGNPRPMGRRPAAPLRAKALRARRRVPGHLARTRRPVA